jgi:hypothetical protein
VYNKGLFNVGKVFMYGQPRTQVLTRLHQEVLEGDTEAYIDPNLDLVPGDLLYFAPTSILHTAVDYMTVLEYNDASGLVKTVEEFDHYHFGSDDTMKDY